MTDLRKAAEMALEALDSDNPDIQLRAAIALRQALEDKPPVKSYAGGKPNYCTPQPEVCCGEYARCLKVCIPKERWFAQQKLNVDAVNMSEERVDETAKSKHKWVGLTDVNEMVEAELTHYCNGEYDYLTGARDHLTDFAQAIEAKLKEKNT